MHIFTTSDFSILEGPGGALLGGPSSRLKTLKHETMQSSKMVLRQLPQQQFSTISKLCVEWFVFIMHPFYNFNISRFWSPPEELPASRLFVPLIKKGFGIVEKCCCGRCHKNMFRQFQNFAFLRLFWKPPFKGLQHLESSEFRVPSSNNTIKSGKFRVPSSEINIIKSGKFRVPSSEN